MDRSISPPGLVTPFGSYSESSTPTPGFHALVQSRSHLPVKDYAWYRVDGECSGHYCDGSPKVTSGIDFVNNAWQSGNLVTLYGRSAPVDSNDFLFKLVENRLNGKLRNSDIDLGVSLGEYRETAAFLSKSVVKVAKSYRQLRKGDVSGAMTTLTGRPNSRWKDIPGASSDAWLAYTYGLRPLVNDVYGACSALEKAYARPRDLTRIVSRLSKTTVMTIGGEVSFNLVERLSIAGRRTLVGVFSYRVANPLVHSLDQLGVINPLSVAWELVPFSFVVDWFIPVGRFISDIVPPQGLDFMDGYVYLKGSGTATYRITQPPGVFCTYGADETDEVRSVRKERRVLHGFPRFHLVTPDLSLSKGQVASAMALLYQQLAR